MGRQHIQARHQHVEQPVTRRLVKHAVIAAIQHGSIHLPGEGSQKLALAGNSLPESRGLQPGGFGDISQGNVRVGPGGEQSEKSLDSHRPVIGTWRGFAAALPGLACGAFCFRCHVRLLLGCLGRMCSPYR